VSRVGNARRASCGKVVASTLVPGGARLLRAVVFSLLALAPVGCAGAGGLRGLATADGPGVSIGTSTLPRSVQDGWRALADADLVKAARAFSGPLDGTPGEAAARFGRITLAFEAGRDAEALDESLILLTRVGKTLAAQVGEAASDRQQRALAALLADATAARLHELLDAVIDPRPFEARLLALSPAGLPWRARLAIEEAIDLVARRRGDAAALAHRPAVSGCLADVAQVAVAGRLPHVDLAAAKPTPLPAPIPLRASGCRLWLPARDGWPGVRLLRASLPPASAAQLLVLDFEGPARISLAHAGTPDQPLGAALHGSDARYGPRASTVIVPPSREATVIEVRLGIFGGGAELRLFALPEAEAPRLSGIDTDLSPGQAGDPASAATDGQAALIDLAGLLAQDSAGQTDRALASAARLAARPRFSVGLSAAAEVMADDPSRPAALARAEADGLLRRAIGLSPALVRALRALAGAELGHGRGSEAAQLAEQALAANPAFWPAAVTLGDAQRSRGLERQADLTLDRAMGALGAHDGACPIVQLAYEQARGRHQLDAEHTLMTRLGACDSRIVPEVEWHNGRGEPLLARAAFARKEATTLDRASFATEMAALDVAAGDARSAAARLRGAISDRLRDPALRIRFIDALLASGDRAAGDAALADTIRWFPADTNVAKLARLRGLPLPMADYHRDARAIIAEFQANGAAYAAPAVLVLDRTVVRVLDDGAIIVLTHNIVKVLTKDGITRWGEVAVPQGAEILALRTHKADGSTREPEEISGKETISAPDLAPGDFVEWETIEYRAPSDGLAPGFLAERFYFQSVELPLHLSELVLVVPPKLALAVDARAGAPAPSETRAADGARVLQFTARHMPQLFAERASVRPEDWIPSVRISAGLTLDGYVRTLRDNLYGVARTSPALRAEALRIAGSVGPGHAAIANAIVRWVMDHIEAEPNLYESATGTLARGRGNRAALVVALARALGVNASLALARTLGAAPAEAPAVPQELDDFSDVLVRFADLGDGGGVTYLDPRYEHAAFGYLPPGLDGAAVLAIDTGRIEIARGRSDAQDERRVSVDLHVDEGGQASGTVVEELRGWPAIEWAAFAKELGDDSRKLRQEFEQRWLGQHFPGARLGGLAIDVDRARPGEARLRYAIQGLDLGGDEDDQASAGSGRMVPPFFRSSPGRRFATVATRRIPMLLGPEVPLSLLTRIALPAGARVGDVGRGGQVGHKEGVGLFFSESRRILPPATGAGPVIELRRLVRLPLLRVEPKAYETLARDLRRIDALERAEIHFSLPPGRTSPVPPAAPMPPGGASPPASR
jgi:hypothetical protein